ncbi:hypothetical protein AbHV_ORF60_2 [Abalone herpesvirus Victoria/AUS/2009]|uniref:Uncharacterized protein n=1 Tax=Abalone herpesvirus (isolate Abalone/Australia/Victoria/2009) TaxID=1241371 RepID=K4K8N8_ABHV|nr:hypothetical protein AbHV_ORF60 [Abalone herpesvirus Victoria/AUS/2009]YP_006908767.1 hypothetical protein AbHV_ORF60_2 [Abalone herpesvirus Victoria/AUS/2009]AFU90072.1 hypothetical protein AbHV_ORF60 [Abalone herpesvirus Victoria/AUS/2009]AFU90127.1 hypothetical protein AbHV_ORF60_2 [Abalone herpesvirus Victoria/AUS/2009]
MLGRVCLSLSLVDILSELTLCGEGSLSLDDILSELTLCGEGCLLVGRYFKRTDVMRGKRFLVGRLKLEVTRERIASFLVNKHRSKKHLVYRLSCFCFCLASELEFDDVGKEGRKGSLSENVACRGNKVLCVLTIYNLTLGVLIFHFCGDFSEIEGENKKCDDDNRQKN